MSLADKIALGDAIAVSRFIRAVDDGEPGAEATLKQLFKFSGRADILGITGTAGAGKSTLASLVIGYYRQQGKRVGVVAVDPTSPFTGGAILGDRVRMGPHNADPEVFIRSVATRGAFGGLSMSVVDIIHVLEAAGKDLIIVETVGVGQDEIDIAGIAGAVVVVTAPGLGDDVQAIKAGLLEIADIFVVNKRDIPGAERAARELSESSASGAAGRQRPVFLTDAIKGEGVPEMLAGIEASLARLKSSRARSQYLKRRYRFEIELKVRDLLVEGVRRSFEKGGALARILDAVSAGKLDPYSAVERAMKRMAIE